MQKIILCLALVSLLFSCGDESTEIGSSFFSDGALDLTYIDSTTVNLSTIVFDSLYTSQADRIVAGTYNESYLGQISMMPVMEFSNPDIDVDLEDINASFYKLVLFLKYDTYSYYDTANTVTLNVHELTDELEERDDGYFYNFSEFSYSADVLGSMTFTPEPNKEDSIEIELSTVLGQDFFDQIVDETEALTTYSKFIKYFNGIAVIPEIADEACMVGFDIEPELRLYYYDKSTTPVDDESYISFSVTSGLIYTAVDVDRSSTLWSSLDNSEERIYASATDDVAALQAGSGLAVRIDMPYLVNLNELDNFYMVQALLEFYPAEDTYSDTEPLPESFSTYVFDSKNSQTGTLSNSVTLYDDEDLGRDTHYYLDITDFVESQMEEEETNENALVLTLPIATYRAAADRLYIASPEKDSRTRLVIYFATINTNDL